MEKYVVTRESEYCFEPGFKVGDVVCVNGSVDPMEYGGFVYRADSPRPKEHNEGCYYHSSDWCRMALDPYVALQDTPEDEPDMTTLIKRHAEFRRAGDWLYRGFFVGKDCFDYRTGGPVRGWQVLGIDPYAKGESTRPFKRMRDAFAWVERTYGDSHVA